MYTPRFRPQPFGPVVVTTPGTPVPLTSQMVASGLCLATDHIPVNKVNLKSLTMNHSGAGNAGNVYVGFAGMNKATGYNLLVTIVPGGADYSITNNGGNNTYSLENFLIDADNAGDGVYGSSDQD
jgi:hypothetical protein